MKDQSKTDNVVVVTGGAKGIGAACIRLFFESGAKTIMLDVEPPEEEIMKKTSRFFECDVSDDFQVKSVFEAIASQFHHVDYLINNAGIQRYGKVTEISVTDWDEVLNVNLKSAFLCTKYAIPLMGKMDGGVIINVSSVQAFLSQDQVAAYTTSKTALLGLTRSIAVDYAPNIRCVAVCPGTVDTPMLRWSANQSADPESIVQECKDMHPLKRIAQPDEIASLIQYLCSEKASFITGQAIRIDGGLGLSISGSKR